MNSDENVRRAGGKETESDREKINVEMARRASINGQTNQMNVGARKVHFIIFRCDFILKCPGVKIFTAHTFLLLFFYYFFRSPLCMCAAAKAREISAKVMARTHRKIEEQQS